MPLCSWQKETSMTLWFPFIRFPWERFKDCTSVYLTSNILLAHLTFKVVLHTHTHLNFQYFISSHSWFCVILAFIETVLLGRQPKLASNTRCSWLELLKYWLVGMSQLCLALLLSSDEECISLFLSFCVVIKRLFLGP